MNVQDKEQFWHTFLTRTIWISSVFVVLVFVFFAANYLQLKSSDPLNSPALEKLYQDLDQNPNNAELREQIRSLDLLARKAYFTKQWQINTGGALLFIGVIVLVFSIKTRQTLRKKLVEEAVPLQDTWEGRLLARKWLGLSGVILVSVTILLALITKREMETASFVVREAKSVKAPDTKEVINNWPSFRGPYGHGQAAKADIPTTWNGESGENILWQVPVPKPGFNSPIVWDDLLFISGADKTSQEVYCYRTDSGQLLWTALVSNVPGSPANPPNVSQDTGYAAPTMATNGNDVFAIFATGDLVCLDLQGQQVWAKNLGEPDNHYGHSSSLIMYENMLLVQYDNSQDAYVTALNAADGSTIWKTPRDMGLSWSSPILAKVGKQWELILDATPNVVAYDVETGAELWRVDCLSGEVAPSPAYADGIVYAVNDLAVLAAIKPGDVPEILWEYEDDLPDVPSPLAIENYLILPSSWGVLTCLRAETGEVVWTQEFDDGFYSSPVLAGKYILAVDMEGVTQVIEPGDEFNLVSSNPLGEKVVTTPAIKDDRVYIRGENNLYCIGK